MEVYNGRKEGRKGGKGKECETVSNQYQKSVREHNLPDDEHGANSRCKNETVYTDKRLASAFRNVG